MAQIKLTRITATRIEIPVGELLRLVEDSFPNGTTITHYTYDSNKAALVLNLRETEEKTQIELAEG